MKSIEESLPTCIKNLQIEQDEESYWKVKSEFCFPATFPAFGGHFPGIPILPGIVQLSSVRYIAEQALGKLLQPEKYNKVKFRSMIKPEQKVQIDVEISEKESQYHSKFHIRDINSEIIANGLGIYSELKK